MTLPEEHRGWPRDLDGAQILADLSPSNPHRLVRRPDGSVTWRRVAPPALPAPERIADRPAAAAGLRHCMRMMQPKEQQDLAGPRPPRLQHLMAAAADTVAEMAR